MSRYRREAWEGKTEAELTVGYGTVLSMEVSGSGLVPLPLRLPFDSGEVMVVRRDFCAHPKLLALRDLIVARLRQFAERYPEIRLEPPDSRPS
jgi:DNA-binding transcriptional LysR family regulator